MLANNYRWFVTPKHKHIIGKVLEDVLLSGKVKVWVCV